MDASGKKKLAIFDIDGTLFRSSLVVELHWNLIKLGIFPKEAKEEVDDYYFAWRNREAKDSYDKYIEKVVFSYLKHLKGRKVSEIQAVVEEVVRAQSKIVYVYTRELIEEIKDSYVLVALSGSPTIIVEEFTKQWGFDYAMGSKYEVEEGVYSGKAENVSNSNKEKEVKFFAKDHGFSLRGSMGVGDTESDTGIFKVVENPICFNPNKALYEIARKKKWPVIVERKDVIYEIQ